jgi:hypothetical protein
MEEKEMNVESNQKVDDSINQNQYKLSDEHVVILSRHVSTLQNYYNLIGSQFCEIMKNVNQAHIVEGNIEQLQSDISKELELPDAKRLNWNLAKKIVEIVR